MTDVAPQVFTIGLPATASAAECDAHAAQLTELTRQFSAVKAENEKLPDIVCGLNSQIVVAPTGQDGSDVVANALTVSFAQRERSDAGKLGALLQGLLTLAAPFILLAGNSGTGRGWKLHNKL